VGLYRRNRADAYDYRQCPRLLGVLSSVHDCNHGYSDYQPGLIMGVPGSVNNLLAAGGTPQYKIERSLKFNGSIQNKLEVAP